MRTHGSRRAFLISASAGALWIGCSRPSHSEAPKDADKDEEVTPAEDLMREHGVLRRVMFLYDEAALRLENHTDVPLDALAAGARMIRRVIEDYHEKLEEDFLFPRFEKAGKLVELVATLRGQHQAGRAATDRIRQLATPASAADDAGKKALIATIRAFVRMYRPHEAREETVLFPALRSVVSPKDFHELGELFEDKEHALFGKEGFEGIVVQVAKLEETLGLADLEQFT